MSENKQKAVVLDVAGIIEALQKIRVAIETEGLSCDEKEGRLWKVLENVVDGDYSTPVPSTPAGIDVPALRKELHAVMADVYNLPNITEAEKLYKKFDETLTAIEKAQEGQRRHVVVEDTEERRWPFLVIDLTTMKSVQPVGYFKTRTKAQAKADELDGVVEEKEWTAVGDKERCIYKHNGKQATNADVLNALNK